MVSADIDRLPEELAGAREEHVIGLVPRLFFTWAGGAERAVPHYYRVQGPRLLIEYDSAQRLGNQAHSASRDPEGDFGGDILRRHHLGVESG